ncbi:unnamed protein product [Anisakis simplex]|uniref:Twisted gastrulation protein homolog 1 (inferred by orthology to a human protein) n=1 Tax=Anisakis simplex TaxID=6269 RepID=A0A0M3K2G2_ANISI|nr:unnamed protein product [Anisakis simplex]
MLFRRYLNKLGLSVCISGLCNPGKEAPHMNSYVDKFDQDEEDLIVFDKVATESKSGTFCTVVYLDKCISHEQCSRQCLILGASMLRWFHTGCCECIGHTCLPYGSNIARCKYCTEFDEDTHSQLAFRQSEL